jgi:hypothetical protein
MARAWAQSRARPGVTLALDLRRLGIVVVSNREA